MANEMFMGFAIRGNMELKSCGRMMVGRFRLEEVGQPTGW